MTWASKSRWSKTRSPTARAPMRALSAASTLEARASSIDRLPARLPASAAGLFELDEITGSWHAEFAVRVQCALVRRIVETVADEAMVDAVLDDADLD